MKKRKGLTLIEVIISITILSMIALVVLVVFGSSLRNITRAGKRTEDVLNLESEINKEIFSHIADEESEEEEDIDTSEEDRSAKVELPNVDEMTIEGKLIIKEKDNIRINTFIPYD